MLIWKLTFSSATKTCVAIFYLINREVACLSFLSISHVDNNLEKLDSVTAVKCDEVNSGYVERKIFWQIVFPSFYATFLIVIVDMLYWILLLWSKDVLVFPTITACWQCILKLKSWYMGLINYFNFKENLLRLNLIFLHLAELLVISGLSKCLKISISKSF